MCVCVCVCMSKEEKRGGEGGGTEGGSEKVREGGEGGRDEGAMKVTSASEALHSTLLHRLSCVNRLLPTEYPFISTVFH